MLNEKIDKKTSVVPSNSYSSIQKKTQENANQNKNGRKVPITPTSVTNQNRKKVSTKKDVQTPSSQNQGNLSVSNRVPPSPTDQRESNCRELAERIRADISGVDPKESLCHSFMSNMTSFLT